MIRSTFLETININDLLDFAWFECNLLFGLIFALANLDKLTSGLF